MKEIDGLIACSHYGVIEWLCTYDQTVNADVARKRSAWSHGGMWAAPPSPGRYSTGGGKALGTPDCPRSLRWAGVLGPHPAARGWSRSPGSSSGTGSPKPITGRLSSWPGLWGTETMFFNEAFN